MDQLCIGANIEYFGKNRYRYFSYSDTDLKLLIIIMSCEQNFKLNRLQVALSIILA